MCDCIRDLNEKLTARVTETAATENKTVLPLNESLHGDGLDGGVFMMVTADSGLDSYVLSTQFHWRTSFIKKDKTESIPKKNHATVAFTYCPFCGVPYKMKKSDS